MVPVPEAGTIVCLITPNHLSTNPRLVKEAIALEKNGFNVHIVFTQSITFETDLDNEILHQHPSWSFTRLDWSGRGPNSSAMRFAFGVCQKLAGWLFYFTGGKRGRNSLINRNFYWQLKAAVAVKAGLYIAHNLGALPVAQKAAKITGAKYGFDAEDFHRYESSNDPLDRAVVLKAAVEQAGLPGVNHLTAASPLIGEAYQRLFPDLSPRTVRNVFPWSPPESGSDDLSGGLKLFWFSQTIGPYRGLETVLDAMALIPATPFELHLLGNPIPAFTATLTARAESLGIKNGLVFHGPVPEKDIFRIAATCHIGLACETGEPYNRDICLTNKLFTYIQSGLAVSASATKAQQLFFKEYPGVGRLYEKNSSRSLAEALSFYVDHPGQLQAARAYNLALVKNELNWEREQDKFISAVKATMDNKDLMTGKPATVKSY